MRTSRLWRKCTFYKLLKRVRIGSVIIFQRAGNRSKLPKTSPYASKWNSKCFRDYSKEISGLFERDFGRVPKGPKPSDFDQKAWAIAHGFETDFG